MDASYYLSRGETGGSGGSGHGSNLLHGRDGGSPAAQAGGLHAPPSNPSPNFVVKKKKKRGRPRKFPLPDNITKKQKLPPPHDLPLGFSPEPNMTAENCTKRKRKPMPLHHIDSHSSSSDTPLVFRRRSSSWKKVRKTKSQFTREPIRVTRQESTCLHYRSTLVSNIKFFTNITLRQKNIDSISKTPFGEFLMPFLEKKISASLVQKSDNEIYKLLLTYNSSKRRFIIAEKELTITPVECKLIFGIKCGRKEMHIIKGEKCRKPSTGFVARRFPDIKELTTKMLTDCLIELKDRDDETAINDVTRIIILQLMVNFFFTSTRGYVVPWMFVELVEDLDKINDYNWAKEITSFLLESVHKSRPKCVPGCTMLLTYWFCERTALVKPTHENTFPRFRKWNLTTITEKLSQISVKDILPDQVHENPMKPSLKELKILGMLHDIESDNSSDDCHEPLRKHQSPQLDKNSGAHEIGDKSYWEGDELDASSQEIEEDVESDNSDDDCYEPLPKHRAPELDKNSQVHECGYESYGEGDELGASSQGTPPQFSIENQLATADLIEDIGSLKINITDLEAENVVDAIKAKHGDIDKDCFLRSQWVRKQNLICICYVLKELQKKSLDDIDVASLEEYYEVVRDIEKLNINVKWLLQRLDEIKDVITSRDKANGFTDEKKEWMKKMVENRREVERLNNEFRIYEGHVGQLTKSISNQIFKVEKFQKRALIDGLI